MIVEKRLSDKGYSKSTYEFLIRCDGCGKEEWLPGNRCNYGKRKFCSRKCTNLGREKPEAVKKHLSLLNSGENNPFYGKNHDDETRQIMSQKQKEIGGLKKNIQSKLDPADFERYWENYRSKFEGINNPFFGRKHSESTRKHLSEVKAKLISEGLIDLKPSHYGLKGYYTSSKSNEIFRFDSFIELLRMIMLDDNDHILEWTKRHGIRIKYTIDESEKQYIPDFLIKYKDCEVIEEVKGYENKNKKKAKFDALKKYCSSTGYGCSIVTYDDMRQLTRDHFGKSIDVLRVEYKKGVFCAQD